MIADRGNNRILVVDPAGQVVFRYPRPAIAVACSTTTTRSWSRAANTSSPTRRTTTRSSQVSLKDRSMKLLFGHPGEPGSDSTHVNTPDDAYMLPDGTFTVADASNCRILFIRARRIVRSYGHAGDLPPRPAALLHRGQRRHAGAGRRRDGERDRRQLDRRNRPRRQAALGDTGARRAIPPTRSRSQAGACCSPTTRIPATC